MSNLIKCKYPENSGLYLLPCPNCNSEDVEESGDDFDGDVSCNNCSLTTHTCYGTKAAIRVWNKRSHTECWSFLIDTQPDMDYMI